jgi:hypothetical protein
MEFDNYDYWGNPVSTAPDWMQPKISTGQQFGDMGNLIDPTAPNFLTPANGATAPGTGTKYNQGWDLFKGALGPELLSRYNVDYSQYAQNLNKGFDSGVYAFDPNNPLNLVKVSGYDDFIPGYYGDVAGATLHTTPFQTVGDMGNTINWDMNNYGYVANNGDMASGINPLTGQKYSSAYSDLGALVNQEKGPNTDSLNNALAPWIKGATTAVLAATTGGAGLAAGLGTTAAGAVAGGMAGVPSSIEQKSLTPLVTGAALGGAGGYLGGELADLNSWASGGVGGGEYVPGMGTGSGGLTDNLLNTGGSTSITGVPGATDFADAGANTFTDATGNGTAIDNLINTGNTVTNQTTIPTTLDTILNTGGATNQTTIPTAIDTLLGTGGTIGDTAGVIAKTGAAGEGLDLLLGGTGDNLDMGDLGGGTVDSDTWGSLKDILGTNVIGNLSAGKLAALAALLGGSSYLSSNAQKDVSNELWNKQQSVNEANKQFWLQNAFPKAAVVDARRASALADLNRRAETQKANLMDTMAGRGLGGGGIVAKGLTDIDQSAQQNYAKLANELTQFENTPLFNPPYASATTPQSYTTTAQTMADMVKALTAQYGGASIYKDAFGGSNNNSAMNNILLQILSGYNQ